MHVHAYERFWIYLNIVILIILFGAVAYASAGLQIRLPDAAETVVPAAVSETAPFDSPGVTQTGDKQYQVVMTAQRWSFTPGEIRVPPGSEVTFIVTSTDLIHGLHVAGTTINAMVIPGEVTRVTYQFDQSGEYIMRCHEYCGPGHHTMQGRIIVAASPEA